MVPGLAHGQRIDPGAREVLAYRLTPDTIGKLRRVMLALDGYRAPSPEAMRPDVAMVSVLALTIPYGGSFTDTQVGETTDLIDRGHHDLSVAIRQTGLTTREYVLAWITLLAAHPTVAAQRVGRVIPTGSAPENLGFVERNWSDVDQFMKEMGQRIERARSGR